MKMRLGDFADAISTRIWERVGRANWRQFIEARAFVRGLGLKSVAQWSAYCKSGTKPPDIPADPQRTYAEAGWAGYGDWLGTGTIAPFLREYRSFKNARLFARDLGLRSQTEWIEYCKSGKKPTDIPNAPNTVYAEAGWAGYGDWLGTVRFSDRDRRAFKEARAFVRGLGLKSALEWYDYCQCGKRPTDIPSNPNQTYAKAGWAGMADWLGTDRFHGIGWRPFKQARAFVRHLDLQSREDWINYCDSGRKPPDIPKSPHSVYSKTGWVGMGDWLGTDAVATQLRQYRSFEKARRFVRGLGLKSTAQWTAYCKSGRKPPDIPADPQRTYAETGWTGIGDWLGTGRRRGGWRAFKQARAFVHRLKFKSIYEWRDYCQAAKKPTDIPSNPDSAYREAGWIGYGDWLGTGTVASFLRQYRPFKKARAFVHGLGLKSGAEWRDYAKSGKKPADIPANPSRTYAESGWAGMGDWLGTGRLRGTDWRSFKQARVFARNLGLKSWEEWIEYCASGRRPANIPSNPNRTYAEEGWLGWGDWLRYSSNSKP
jgi:hypothetical protein